MFSSKLVLAAGPAGLAAGALAWLAAGGVSAGSEKLAPLEQSVAQIPSPRHSAPFIAIAASDLAATPLFAMTVGAAAVKVPVVRVDGLTISRSRTAALLAIDGAPAEWLLLGERRGGVTLQEVRASGVVIDTITGPSAVGLGEQSTATAASAAQTAAMTPSFSDAIPPGVRLPPAPASAP